ncbi:hypothetical protein HN385_00145 [archaeon]|nr:hypothetical protein [archaeon]MBT3451235.1 hypothetical protein [archaeon]MBT6869036.1 hypothetical protein [archaeon]MBT7193624.1 hypothetical protein [archaeon]MBT7380157.1 hypothetical protein [archaeon]
MGGGELQLITIPFNITGSSGSFDVRSDVREIFDTSLTNLVTMSQPVTFDIVECTSSEEIICYLDSDDDGYGDSTVSESVCSSCSIGYIDNNLDCDDTDSLIHVFDSSHECATATITSCGAEINSPGEYILISDLPDCTDDGININSDNVNLNCQGYEIEGDGEGNGISLNSVEHVTVMGCNVGSFTQGFYLSSSNSNNFSSNSAFNNYNGFYLSSSNNNNLTNNSGFNNYVGFFYGSSQNNILINNSAYSNSWYGFKLFSSDGNLLFNNFAHENSRNLFIENSFDTVINNSLLCGSTNYDLYSSSSSFTGENNYFDTTSFTDTTDTLINNLSCVTCGGYTCEVDEVCSYGSLCSVDSDEDSIGMIEDICRYNSTDSFCNTLLFYSFDGGTGTTLIDGSTNDNAGTSYTVAWSNDSYTGYLSSMYPGLFNASDVYSLNFSAPDAYLTASSVNPTNYLTLDVLIKLNNLTEGTILENYNSDGVLSYRLDLVESTSGHLFNFVLQDTSGGIYEITSSGYSSYLGVDEWYILTVVYDSEMDFLNMYVQKEAMEELDISTNATQINSGENFVIGAGWDSITPGYINYTNITIDSLKIYDKVILPCLQVDCPDSYYCDDSPNELSLCQVNESYEQVSDPQTITVCSESDPDLDGDGYCSDEDCDDGNSTIGSTFSIYEDADFDGYFSSTVTTTYDCTTTPLSISTTYNYSTSAGTDCDDTNVSVYTSQTLYADSDSDGFYSKTSSSVCTDGTTPEGYLGAVGTDCNDADSTINENATESCGDSVDNDCNDYTDCDDSTCSEDASCVELSTQPIDNTTIITDTSGSSSSSGGGGRGASCQEDWSCSTWSYCNSSLLQSRTCTDANSCSAESDMPNQTQSCDGCGESWICTSWSECSSGDTQTRSCYDEHSCGSYTYKPDTSKNCDEEIVDDTSYVTIEDTSGGSSDESSSSSTSTTSTENEQTYNEPPVPETVELEIQEPSQTSLGIYGLWEDFKYFVIGVPTALLLFLLIFMILLHRSHDKKPAVNHGQLDSYIKSEMAAGMSQDVIEKNLKTSGWNDQEISDGLNRFNNSKNSPAN